MRLSQQTCERFEALLREAREGSSAAVGELFQLHRDWLRREANRAMPKDLASKKSPSDLVQDTLLDALEQFSQFHGASQPMFLAWLLRILRTNLFDFCRAFRERQKRQVGREETLSDLTAGDGAAPRSTVTASTVEEVIRRETAWIIHSRIGTLPEKHQQVIRLHAVEKRTFVEAGAALDLSEEAARKLYARALRALTEELHAP
jgi:RNA polymerase sigma-70 factor (ECF subfamily)